MNDKKALIGKWYKERRDADEYANYSTNFYKGKRQFFVVEYNEGFIVVSEDVARACFPELKI